MSTLRVSDTVQQPEGDESIVRQPAAQIKSKQRQHKPISAQRRLQNCNAQRAYRQRKREKLKELEAKVASLELGRQAKSVSEQTPASLLATPTPLRIEGAPISPAHVTPTAAEPTEPYNLTSWNYDANIWLEDPASTSSSIETGSLSRISPNESQPMIPENTSTENFSALLSEIDTGALSSIEVAGATTSAAPERSDHVAPAASSSSLLSVKTSASMYSTSRSHTRKDIQIYRPSSRQLSSKPQLILKWFLSLPQSTRRLLAHLAKDGDFSFVDMISSLLLADMNEHNPDSGESRLLEMSSAMSPAASYSPYRNSLRIARFSYFSALFTNFSSLGFDFGLFLDERSVSPFCIGAPRGEAAASTAATREENIPLDLRPIPSQYTVTHHPYIDSLPFPTFRQRALAALATDPPLLDEDDLCLDLMLHDGLVCWGSSNPNGIDHGTPWDSHSWEAKEWFLRKWKWLIGGQDSELWHSSRWWAGQRGEYISM